MNIVKDWEYAGDTDEKFLTSVQTFLTKLYDGIRIGSWGQFQGSYSQDFLGKSHINIIQLPRVED
jgi:hypothetical protein